MIRLIVKFRLRAVKGIRQEYFDFDDETYTPSESNIFSIVSADLQERIANPGKIKDLSVAMYENLNIHDAILVIYLKALNKNETIPEAAAALGISTRALYNYRKKYDIIQVDDVWIQKEKPVKKIIEI